MRCLVSAFWTVLGLGLSQPAIAQPVMFTCFPSKAPDTNNRDLVIHIDAEKGTFFFVPGQPPIAMTDLSEEFATLFMTSEMLGAATGVGGVVMVIERRSGRFWLTGAGLGFGFEPTISNDEMGAHSVEGFCTTGF
jgi:hypothetical protein